MTSEVVNNAATSTNEVGSSERTNNPSDFQGAAPVIQWPSQNIPGTAGGFSGFTPAPNFHRNNAVRLPQTLTLANVDPDDTEDDNATIILASSSKAPHAMLTPNCRLFVVCAKNVEKATLKHFFQAYGEVKQVFIIKDKQSKQNKGCAFVTFSSSYPALRALEAVGDFNPLVKGKPLKARLAKNPQGGAAGAEDVPDESEQARYLEKLKKLRVSVQPSDSEDSLASHFSQFGKVEFVNIVRNSATLEPSGSAIVKFERPSFAAKAVETDTVTRFHPVIAAYCPPAEYTVKNWTPHMQQTRHPASAKSVNTLSPHPASLEGACPTEGCPQDVSTRLTWEQNMMASTILGLPHRDLVVRYDSSLTNEQLYKLFDIVPGLEEIKLGGSECVKDHQQTSQMSCCYPKYKTPLNALYAKEKLNGFEYPLGKFITVCFKSNLSTTEDGVIALSDPPNATTATSAMQNSANKPNFPSCSYWNLPNQNSTLDSKQGSSVTTTDSLNQPQSSFMNSGPGNHPLTASSTQGPQVSSGSQAQTRFPETANCGSEVHNDETYPPSCDFINGASECFTNDDFGDSCHDDNDDDFEDDGFAAEDHFEDTSHYWNPPPVLDQAFEIPPQTHEEANAVSSDVQSNSLPLAPTSKSGNASSPHIASNSSNVTQ